MTRQDIMIHTVLGRLEIKDAEIKGHFAIHHTPSHSGFGPDYSITHIPTGRSVDNAIATVQSARKIIKELQKLDVDWSLSDREAVSRNLSTDTRRSIRRILGLSS